MLATQNDAAFFGMIHTLIQKQQAALRERRGAKRSPYEFVQLVAPFDGESLPAQSAFRLVQCYDLSSTGFSFVMSALPNFDQVVVALGVTPFKFFVAEVMRAGPAPSHFEGRVMVGCRFVRRLLEAEE